MKSTTRPTRTRATYRRSDSADTTDAAKARQRLKRNDDRAESIAQERRIGPEPGATVRASVRAGSHGYGKTRPDDGAKSRRRGRWTAERIVLECPISFRSCPQRRPSRCSFTTVAPPQRRWTGDSTAQSKGKRGSPARAGIRRRQRVRKLSAVGRVSAPDSCNSRDLRTERHSCSITCLESVRSEASSIAVPHSAPNSYSEYTARCRTV